MIAGALAWVLPPLLKRHYAGRYPRRQANLAVLRSAGRTRRRTRARRHRPNTTGAKGELERACWKNRRAGGESPAAGRPLGGGSRRRRDTAGGSRALFQIGAPGACPRRTARRHATPGGRRG
jgi:hypothetical protein